MEFEDPELVTLLDLVIKLKELLKGAENYTIWRIQLRAILRGRGLWGYVTGEKLEPHDTKEETDPEKGRSEADLSIASVTCDRTTPRESQDEQSLAFIILSVDESLYPYLDPMKTSREAWLLLSKLFERRQ
ncbi:hypothetical protein SISSUDRAFT_1031730 [Sistotremastrum suecicum HHB10207 ss-3]|uniref:Uncharacterized protein n=1 Tax=Sistotremastrum suecicum HHB10207 ss-3 TaxID=1314776 RepID=A0A166FJE6_9AGAM|nr:hypothetical protein SISSUDRAFT_1031730 [Sistotremastrum suecicum HHB10207 ss-3]